MAAILTDNSMASAQLALYYTRSSGKALYQYANLVYHIMPAYYQVMHWKAADQRISKSRYWLISLLLV